MRNADQSTILIISVLQKGPFWPMTLKPTQQHSGLWATTPYEIHGSLNAILATLLMHSNTQFTKGNCRDLNWEECTKYYLPFHSLVVFVLDAWSSAWLSSIMHPGHMYNDSEYVFVCDQSIEDHRMTEWASLSSFCDRLVLSFSTCHILTHVHTCT